MRLSLQLLSPRLKRNTHPRNTVRWKPRSGSNGFYKPHKGGSKFKWQFTLPYTREFDSLHHYPAVSQVSGKPIDWYEDEPQDGYEAVRIYGENTLELKGMPLGKTPEYVQERLRRFFAKFGPVQHCRADPHPLDPYQCEGTAHVTFRDAAAAAKALRAPLKFPASLHDKVISMKNLDTDQTNDPMYREKAKWHNRQLLSIARQLHVQLQSAEFRGSGKPFHLVDRGLWEEEMVELPAPEFKDPWGAEASAARAPWGRGGVPFSKKHLAVEKRVVPAQESVLRRFGNWAEFLTMKPMDELFAIEGAGEENLEALVVHARLVSSTQRVRVLTRLRVALEEKLHEEFSVWWREGKVPLPAYTQRRVEWWDRKPPLPFELQIQSRCKDRVRIFDEKYLYLQRIVKARRERRKAKAAEWTEERRKLLQEKEQKKKERQRKALEAVSNARCGGLLGNLGYLLPERAQR